MAIFATPPAPKPSSPIPVGFLLLLIALSGLGPLTMQAITPALPVFAAYFKEDVGVAQLTISLYLVGLAVSQLVVGPLSDKFGRRPVILVGLVLMVAANCAAVLADSLTQVISARVAQAIGAACGLAVGRAMIRDVYDRERAASILSVVVGAMMTAPMIAPFVGGILETVYGWKAIFWFLAGLSICVLIWSYACLPETRRVEDKRVSSFLKDARALIISPHYIGYVAASAFAASTFFLFQAATPYISAVQMGRSSAEYGGWYTLGALAYMAGNFTSARLTLRVGSRRMIWIGLAIMFVGSTLNLLWGLVGLSTVPGWLFVTQMIASYGNGYVMPNLTAGAVSVRPEAAGTASGVLGFVQTGLGAIVSQLGAHIGNDYATTVPLNLCVLALTLLCAGVVVLIWLSSRQRAISG